MDINIELFCIMIRNGSATEHRADERLLGR